MGKNKEVTFKMKGLKGKWAVFPDDKYNPCEVHVCPCDKNGNLIINHILDMNCPCMPEMHVEGNALMYIHNYINFN